MAEYNIHIQNFADFYRVRTYGAGNANDGAIWRDNSNTVNVYLDVDLDFTNEPDLAPMSLNGALNNFYGQGHKLQNIHYVGNDWWYFLTNVTNISNLKILACNIQANNIAIFGQSGNLTDVYITGYFEAATQFYGLMYMREKDTAWTLLKSGMSGTIKSPIVNILGTKYNVMWQDGSVSYMTNCFFVGDVYANQLAPIAYSDSNRYGVHWGLRNCFLVYNAYPFSGSSITLNRGGGAGSSVYAVGESPTYVCIKNADDFLTAIGGSPSNILDNFYVIQDDDIYSTTTKSLTTAQAKDAAYLRSLGWAI